MWYPSETSVVILVTTLQVSITLVYPSRPHRNVYGLSVGVPQRTLGKYWFPKGAAGFESKMQLEL